jgi:hypothetical protein
MKITVIQNWLDPYLIDYLSFVFLFGTPHFFQETSSTKNLDYAHAKDVFYRNDFCSRKCPHAEFNPLIDSLQFKINKTFFNQDPEYERVNLNIQHPGMSGGWHNDFTTPIGTTCLLMVSPNNEGGSFFYYNKQSIKEEKYEQNKFIMFDAKTKHRGDCFKHTPRVTLAFKINSAPQK